MSFLNRFLGEQERHPAHPAARVREVAAGAATKLAAQPVLRPSNSLKDFLWHISDVQNGRLLDLGPVAQSTISFFLERGYKIYSEDVLRGWREHLALEEKRLLAAQVGGQVKQQEFAMPAIAARFLETNLRHAAGTFNAALLWDACDFLDAEAMAPVVTRVLELLRPGGVILALFHSRKPEGFYRYRVRDKENIELLPARPLFPQVRILQNRDLLNLFGGFRTSKTFVGRDHLRESIYVK
ncbi:MAG: hypothetical protein ACRD5G_08075 [Candidatus Acidiferrales bacterium]